MLQKAVLNIVCMAFALKRIWFALYDMTHYYWAALIWELKPAILSIPTFNFKASLQSLHSAVLVIRNYLTAIPSYCLVHYKHRLFLHKLGLENNEELTGTYICK